MFDFATTDLTLAIAHHLLIFLLAAILAFEIGMIRPGNARTLSGSGGSTGGTASWPERSS